METAGDRMSRTTGDSPMGWRVRCRTLASVAAHTLLFGLSLLLAFALRYDFKLGGDHPWFVEEYLPYLPLTLLIKVGIFGWMGLYRDSWRYVGLRDLFGIIKASHIAIFVCVIVYWAYVWMWRQYFPGQDGVFVPSSVFLLDWVFTIGLV